MPTLIKRLFYVIVMLPMLATAQITGYVQDEKGVALAFATVYVRNTTNGTVANGDGFFKLQVAPGAHDIVFQYMGYKQHVKNVTLGSKPLQITVQLEPSDLELSEVIITGDLWPPLSFRRPRRADVRGDARQTGQPPRRTGARGTDRRARRA